jgi:hypothetical protein
VHGLEDLDNFPLAANSAQVEQVPIICPMVNFIHLFR